MNDDNGSRFPSDNGIYRIRECGMAIDDAVGRPWFKLALERPDGIAVQAYVPVDKAVRLAEMACDGKRPTGYLHKALEGACVSLHFDASGRADAIGDPFGMSTMSI